MEDLPSQNVVECDLCGDTFNIAWYCKNCPGSLCDKCHHQHQTAPLFKTHSLVPRSEIVLRTYGPGKLMIQCTNHPEKEIITYCNQCKVPCCVTCQVKNHNGHNISTIEDKYLCAEKGLNQYVTDLDTSKFQINRKVKTIREDDETREQEIQKAEDEINSFRSELLQTVNLSCDSKIESLREFKTKSAKCLQSLEEDLVRVRNLQEEIGAKIRIGNLNIIEYTPPSKESLISKIDLPKSLYFKFKPNRKLLTDIHSEIGNVEELSEPKDKCEVSCSSSKQRSFGCTVGVTSMTAAGSNMFWVMNWDSEVLYLYDINGLVVRTVAVKGSKGVRDMALTRSGEMIVSCFDQKIRKVSINGKISTLVDVAPFEPKGVCIDDEENVVVCMAGQRKRNHIAVYSQCGCRKLLEKKGRNSNGKLLVTDPYRVVQIGSDLCVVNVGNIICIDKRDDVKWVYDARKTESAIIFNPYGICVDSCNNILVLDFESSSIRKISSDGVLIKMKLTKDLINLESPQGICVDKYSGHFMFGNVKCNDCGGEVVVCRSELLLM